MKSTKLISLAIAATMISGPALAQTAPTVRITTGGQGNAYWNGCQKLKANFAASFSIECLSSPGSMANLARLRAGEADLAFVQADAMAVAKKDNVIDGIDQIAEVGEEFVQLVCNKKSGITQASDLETASPRPKVLVGPDGSGAATTLRNWIIEDEDYRNIEAVYESATGSGALKLKQNAVACAMEVSAPNGKTMNTLDSAADGQLSLVDIDDGDFNDSTDIDGNPVYRFTEIPSSTYANLIGWSDIDTTVQSTYLVGSSSFTANNPGFMDKLSGMLFIDAKLIK
jgi:TRAP-type uncharacterized transport system substrate-binding protein